MNQQACPIWGQPHLAMVDRTLQGIFVEESRRAAGSYILARDRADFDIDDLSIAQKAKLTTWLIDQRLQGEPRPTITNDVLRGAADADPLSTQARADRLLTFFVRNSLGLGDATKVSKSLPSTPSEMKIPDHALSEAMAWSESPIAEDVTFLLEELIKLAYLEKNGPVSYVVTMAGRNRIESPTPNANSGQAFVAMWFNPTLADAYERGIRPGIKASGYRPLKIDESPDVDKIDDAILEQIERSKFIVVDFTHGQEGPRGSVYFEAGYARALGIPAIYLCRTDITKSLPFDTRQYRHLTWNEPEDIVVALKETIIGRFDEGPYGK